MVLRNAGSFDRWAGSLTVGLIPRRISLFYRPIFLQRSLYLESDPAEKLGGVNLCRCSCVIQVGWVRKEIVHRKLAQAKIPMINFKMNPFEQS